jgi:DNA-binding winged helix-turn-helix (wHTH) protein/TolB-like protein
VLRFGVFELDSEKGELRRNGMLIKLAPQPFQILRTLAERAGEIVTREEIRQSVWGTDTFVDFDRNLNVAIGQVRAALSDDADAPRFVATLPRKGYRFVAPVEHVEHVEQMNVGLALVKSKPRVVPNGRWIVIGVVAAALAMAAAMIFGGKGPPTRMLIAVLAFEDATNRPLLREALLEETIGQLSGIHPLRLGVIARTSAMRFEKQPAGIREIAAALKAEYVVEGSIRQSEGGLRVSARLIQARDQAEVWSSVLEDPSEQVLERDAPAKIAAGVLHSLFPKAPPPKRIGERCGAGAEAYRNGRYLQAKGDVARAAGFFEQAACPEADAALADSLFTLSRSGRGRAGDADRAAEAARRALHSDPENAEALNALANLEFWRLWRFAEAERNFQKALEVNPSFAAAHHDYAWLLVATGRPAEALDPLSPRVNIDAGWLLLQAHKFAEAAAQARHALELEPELGPEARACEARARMFAEGKAAEPVAFPRGPYYQALIAAQNGNRGAALDALEAVVAAHDMSAVMLNSEPAFERLHGEPRFRALVAKVGLP